MQKNDKARVNKYTIHFLLTISSLIAMNNCLANVDTLSGDSTRYVKSIHLNYQLGKVIPTHAFVQGENPKHEPYNLFQAFSAQYGIRTDGRKLWQQLYGYPVWGFGLFYIDFLNDDEFGKPLAIYSYINAPFKRWHNWSVNYEVGFGLSLNWKPHELLEAGYYYPIGSYFTVFFDFGINSSIKLAKNWDLNLGFNYTHFSNGAVKLPNLGVNVFAPQVGVQYIVKQRPTYKVQEVPKYLKEWEWLITASPSIRQVGFTYEYNGDTLAEAFNYGVFTISTAINRQISHKVKFGGGFDFSYNEAYAAETLLDEYGSLQKVPATFKDKFLIGIYPSFELVFNKLLMTVQPGFYIYRQEVENMETPTTYQRVGLRYYIGKHFITGVNIRAYNFSKADFIEFNLGYSLRWQKSYRKN
ncbi:MAG: hypothetical protein C0591_13825 [Marinilabiliales bacterium]|nr:MAG: hypothetical protein C0591_13825 [Marinilabiliales bacterium]